MSDSQSDSPTPHLAVAAEVRACLARRRISGRRAAFALGWKQPYIARRLSGEIPFDVNDLAALAELLGVQIAVFFQAPELGSLSLASVYSDTNNPLRVRALQELAA